MTQRGQDALKAILADVEHEDSPLFVPGTSERSELRGRARVLARVKRGLGLPASSSTLEEDIRSGEQDHSDRYVVLEEVGRGGMGRVLRAYDPKLQREVALKAVHGRELDTSSTRRLVAEARAMAKLSHANVVSVYDVIETEPNRVVLVMEYVAGPSLSAWLKQGPRAWSDVLACFVDAGRGLAAAHAAGLLHRDFKPSNVLVAKTSLKVTDFGLAKLREASGDVSVDDASSRSGNGTGPALGSEGLTVSNVVLGTPRYMAPEQHRGEPLTAAADQYAFCVALWEALCGKAPFTGARLSWVKLRGPPPWPGGPTPRPVVDAVRRGLSPDPADRWPSMEALLDALGYDPVRRRIRWQLAAAGATALGGLVAAVLAWSSARAERCTKAAAVEHLEGVWDESRRVAIHDAIVGIDAAYATAVWTRTEQSLDAYASAWTQMHVDACESRDEQSNTVVDLRMSCLHRAKADLQVVTQVLAEADAQTVQKAHELTGGLRPLSRCSDIEALLADVEPPLPADAPAVEALREQLALAKAATKAGHYEKAKREVDTAKAGLLTVNYGPVHTEVALAEGIVLERLGDYAAAEAALDETVRLAVQWRQWDILQATTARLIFVVGHQQQRFDEGLHYADLARGLAAGDPEREADVDSSLATVHYARGAYAQAVQLEERALAIRERLLGPEHADVATSLNSLAAVHAATGAYAKATALFERALAIREEALGSDHPDVATSLDNLANVRMSTGVYAEAAALHERALAIRERALGPDHPDVAKSLSNLASVRAAMGATAEAAALHERALIIRENALGPEHSEVAASLNNLANLRFATGAYEKAAELDARALAIWEKVLGPDHPHVAASLGNLAGDHQANGEYSTAAELLERALTILEKALGPDHPDVAAALNNVAIVRKAMKANAEAAEAYERALTILEKALGPDHPRVATALGNLANLRMTTRAHAEAAELYARALAIFEKAFGPDHPEVASPLAGLAESALAQRRPRQAVPLAERAVNVREAADVPAENLAYARFVLARALVAARQSRARALELAEQARDGYREAGDAYGEKLLEVEAFLRTHRR